MKIVFDVDDTICTNHRKLSYDKCIPDEAMIQKINFLHDSLGYEICLHTSRGMISCNGDLEKIIQKNKTVLEDWLRENNVHYDELIFGKPIADLYVDDKGMNASDFLTAEFGKLHGGGSKKSIDRLGEIVRKELGSPEETSNFKDWIEDNNGSCLYPHVISYLYDTVYMEYIDGIRLVDYFRRGDLLTLLKTTEKFKAMPKTDFSLEPQMEILRKNKSDDAEMNRLIDKCEDFLWEKKPEIARHASYCHGDMTLGNALKKTNGSIYFIDPRYFRDSSTYLFDLAKLRMSLMDYEKLFGLSSASNIRYLREFDHIIKGWGVFPLVIGLNLMYVCRLYRYKDPEDKAKVKEMATRLYKDYEELFR